ncbi:hypothetical protein BAE44_0014025 [Dichanthelium oligosanthes]|uniref:Uncharacterized protein n=1 Tax=Dichanthelium oligosanthes TaxID=888268 RepID=A0A1E5VIM1_9POAL|nr:hypothetical protein BAE44_0014025 [Dichanthelium oligosanthes]
MSSSVASASSSPTTPPSPLPVSVGPGLERYAFTPSPSPSPPFSPPGGSSPLLRFGAATNAGVLLLLFFEAVSNQRTMPGMR